MKLSNMGKCACGNWCCGGGWTGGVALTPKHHLEALIVGHVVRRECHQETEQGKKYVKNKVLRFM